jgi:adenosylcobinamide kinase / adenosylcobinamide-phosphate guanylyltransferase
MTERLTLILGGARSGKTRHAEGLIKALPAPWIYVATAEIWNEEMRERVERHKADRSEAGWITVEAPLDLAAALQTGHPVLDAATERLAAALLARKAPTILVANEVGLGIVPDNKMARDFRDHAGRLHQRLAAQASKVILMVAGLPMTVK